MSNLRKIRRAQKPGRPQLADQITQALHAVDRIKTLQQDLQGVAELDTLLRKTHALAQDLVEDYQALSARLDMQHEQMLLLLAKLSGDPIDDIIAADNAIHELLSESKETT